MKNELFALIIVDLQNGFINESTKHLPEKIEKLQDNYDHIYAFKFKNYKNSPWEKWIGWTKLTKNDEQCDLAFAPLSRTVIKEKSIYSCFSKEFLIHLQSMKINTIHIVGTDTDVCVLKTATDFFEDGNIRPIVLSKYCASHGGERYHKYALEILSRLIGTKSIK